MHFLKAALVGLSAMTSFVAAQSSDLFFTTVPTNVEVGKTYTIEYSAANINEPVTILLREGESSDLTTVATLTSSATGGSFEWTVDDYPESGNYALEIQQGGEVNYSGQFPITGGTGAAATSGASSTAAASSGAASSTDSSAAASSTVTSSSNSTTTKTTASAATSTNMSRNSTMTSHTLTSKTKGHTTAAASSTGAASSVSGGFESSTTHAAATSVPTGNVAAGIASPFALLFGVVGALAYLN